jgi:hypothetical protein
MTSSPIVACGFGLGLGIIAGTGTGVGLHYFSVWNNSGQAEVIGLVMGIGVALTISSWVYSTLKGDR